MKKIKEESLWDKRKIFIVSFLVLAVILFLAYRAINLSATKVPTAPKSGVKGISAKDLTKGVQENIHNLQQEAENLNVEDVATSSPQVQKIINDLKSIKNIPSNQLKSTCENICKGL